MRAFIEGVIKKAAAEVGIEYVAEKTSTPSNLTMPKPRIDIEYLPESFIATGRKLSARRVGDERITVIERYEIDAPVMLYITHNDDGRLSLLANSLLLAFPKGVPDEHNNWVAIRASTAEWSKTKATTVGIKQINVLHERLRTIRVGFMWRLTAEKADPYITKVNFKIGEIQ